MTLTPYQNDIEKTFEAFDKIDIKQPMQEQIEDYIKVWKDFRAEMPAMNMMMSIPMEQQARENVASFIAELEAVDTANEFDDWDDQADDWNEDYLSRNYEIRTAIELCTLDY